MTQEHPITPTEEVINEWESEWHHHQGKETYEVFMAKQAAQWGADQELEACCEWLETYVQRWAEWSADFRADRRPKPPSLKEQALQALDDAILRGDCITTSDALPAIRRALEQLDD